MYDENQIVKIKWNNTNRSWYESKGYVYTKRFDEFNVFAKDLPLGSACRINAICDYCGCSYSTSFAVLINGRKSHSKDSCPHCASKKVNDINFNRRAEKQFSQLKEICTKYGYTLLTKQEDYTDVKMIVDFICPIHGIQHMMLDNLKRGHKCIQCSYSDRFNNVRLDKDFVEKSINSTNNNIWLNPNEYTNCIDRNLKIKCGCGNIFITSFVNYYKHNINRCHYCSQKESVGELRIRKFLEENHIDFEQEKRFIDCKDKRILPFDFYLPLKNTCIEFDGQQHFQNIFGDVAFENTKRHDKIKNDYCNNNGIRLIRIPYYDGNKIEDILSEKLNCR